MNLKHLPILFLFITIFSQIDLPAQWRTEIMPQSRIQSWGAASEDKLFLPGGLGNNGFFNDIAVYDIETGTWSNIPLTIPRSMISATINGGLLFCAGGTRFDGSNYATVEIYDINTLEQIEVAELSVARVALSAVSVGDKVLFAGGANPDISGPNLISFQVYNRVDIYDVSTKTWSTASLSDPRAGMADAVLGNKAYFAGGDKGDGVVSDVVDIYDASTDTWSTDKLSVARAFYGGGTAFDNKVYFAGGILEGSTNTDIIDIFDPTSNTWATDKLSAPRALVRAGTTSNHLLFTGGSSRNDLAGWTVLNTSNVVDIYDLEKKEWNTLNMESRRANHMTLSIAEQVFIIGGITNTFGGLASDMLVFTNESMTTSTKGVGIGIPLRIYPNPTNDYLFINLEYNQSPTTRLQFFDVSGKQVIDKVLNHQRMIQLDTSHLIEGMYFLTLTSGDYQRTMKVIKH